MRQSARRRYRAAAAVAGAIPVLLALGSSGALAATAARPAAPTPTPAATASATPSASRSATASAPPATPAAPPPTPVSPQVFHVLPRPARGCPPQLGVRKLRDEPWAQQALDMAGAWTVTRGQGVTVAVVDSGVDFSPQLAGRVSAIDLTGQGPRDCVGHGTAVASLIAATDARARGIPFYGVAPAARILSVKVNTGETGVSQLLAQGIRDAAAAGAQVINVSVQTAASSPALRAAVAFALRSDAVVVAAAGNDNPGTGTGPYYPASYPGVLLGGRGQPFRGADCLYRQEHGGLRDRARVQHRERVARRVQPGQPGHELRGRVRLRGRGPGPRGVPAADRGAGGAPDRGHRGRPAGAHTGAGMVNPVQAVTAVLPEPAASPAAAARPVAIPGPARPDPVTRALALAITGGALAVALLVAAAAFVVPRGRRWRWRPARRG